MMKSFEGNGHSKEKSNMGIIDKFKKNIKTFFQSNYLDELFWILLLIFTALSSFSLGARYERETFLSEHPVHIEGDQEIIQAWKAYHNEQKKDARFFASKNGSVYYSLACPAGTRIKDENKVFFHSKEEAEKAGYHQSSRCF